MYKDPLDSLALKKKLSDVCVPKYPLYVYKFTAAVDRRLEHMVWSGFFNYTTNQKGGEGRTECEPTLKEQANLSLCSCRE